jgi:polar amino acid transport system substrate-binding protein
MKVRRFIGIVVLVLFIIPFQASADQITIVGDSWCPFNCEPDAANPGYMIEVAQQIFAKAGHKVTYKTVEWKKAIEETRKGKYTATVGGLKSDTPDFVFPDRAMGTSENIFFAKKGSSWRYSGMDSLKKIRLGVVEGYSYSDEIDRHIAANKGKPAVLQASGDDPLQMNIDRLMKGQIDAFIEDPSVYGSYCGTKKLLNVLGAVQAAGTTGPPDKIYIAFSPANPKAKTYAALLSSGVDQMRKTGELKKILAKYYVKDWE